MQGMYIFLIQLQHSRVVLYRFQEIINFRTAISSIDQSPYICLIKAQLCHITIYSFIIIFHLSIDKSHIGINLIAIGIQFLCFLEIFQTLVIPGRLQIKKLLLKRPQAAPAVLQVHWVLWIQFRRFFKVPQCLIRFLVLIVDQTHPIVASAVIRVHFDCSTYLGNKKLYLE
jgi:hypothetical protein